MVEEVGRVHHRHEREGSRSLGSVGFGVHVVEDEPIDLHRPEPGQGCGGDGVGLVGGGGLSWWSQTVEQDAVTGSGQELSGRCGVTRSHPAIMSALLDGIRTEPSVSRS
jgi:hypothetical protein